MPTFQHAVPMTYAATTRRTNRLLFVLCALNVGFAAAALTMWTFVRLAVAEPMSWAMLSRLGPRPDLLEYPFIVLWLVPFSAATAAWIFSRLQARRAARIVAALPIMIFVMVMGWFYLTPPAWH